MFYICGALLFMVLAPVGAGEDDDVPGNVGGSQKIKALNLGEVSLKKLKLLPARTLQTLEHLSFSLVPGENLKEVVNYLIQFPKLKVRLIAGSESHLTTQIALFQDNQNNITVVPGKNLPDSPPPKILDEIPETLFDYVNLELQLGPDVAERVKRIKAKSDGILVKAREDAMGEINLIGSRNWKEMTIESLKGRVGQIYDRYLGESATSNTK